MPAMPEPKPKVNKFQYSRKFRCAPFVVIFTLKHYQTNRNTHCKCKHLILFRGIFGVNVNWHSLTERRIAKSFLLLPLTLKTSWKIFGISFVNHSGTCRDSCFGGFKKCRICLWFIRNSFSLFKQCLFYLAGRFADRFTKFVAFQRHIVQISFKIINIFTSTETK